MKIIRNITLAYTVVMVIVLGVLYTQVDKVSFRRRDVSYYNDQLHRIYEVYLQGSTEAEIEKEYNCNLLLEPYSPTELYQAYQNSSLVMDFAPEEECIGKIIWDDKTEGLESYKDTFIKTGVIIWGAVLLAGYLFIFIIYRKMIYPVKEMSVYSSEIAKGNLDVQLPMHKQNMFGNFVESFDLMREEIRASHEREMAADKANKELVAELSHDINTPVATIQAACEVMSLKYKDNEDIIEKVCAISQKAETIKSIMDNVFHATMEELDKLEMNVRDESSEVIEGYFLSLSNYGNIILDNHIPGCLVRIDKLRMEQVIDNVVGNSHKYAGTDIHVSFTEYDRLTEADKDNNRFIKITIRDSGPGVEEKDLPLIFEKYYRGSNVKDKKGYGIGMHLVRMYMEKQGGGVECYNDNGFVVELLVRKT